MTAAIDPAGSSDAAVGARQAALLLHGVEDRERELLLAELRPDERAAMQRLLGELSELGLPRSPELVEQCFSSPAPQVVSARVSDVREARSHGLLSGRAIASLLVSEPDELATCALRLADARERTRLWRRLGPVRRSRIEGSWTTPSDTGRGELRDRAIREALLEHAQSVCNGRSLSWTALRRSAVQWAESLRARAVAGGIDARRSAAP